VLGGEVLEREEGRGERWGAGGWTDFLWRGQRGRERCVGWGGSGGRTYLQVKKKRSRSNVLMPLTVPVKRGGCVRRVWRREGRRVDRRWGVVVDGGVEWWGPCMLRGRMNDVWVRCASREEHRKLSR